LGGNSAIERAAEVEAGFRDARALRFESDQLSRI
jgi:hypothetical protein